MTPEDILRELHRRGAAVRLDGAELRVRAPAGALPAELVAMARRAKPALIALVRQDDADAFEERAAILEFDAGLSRSEAERELLKVDECRALMAGGIGEDTGQEGRT